VNLRKYAGDLKRYSKLLDDNQLLFLLINDLNDFHLTDDYNEHEQARKLIEDWESVMTGKNELCR